MGLASCIVIEEVVANACSSPDQLYAVSAPGAVSRSRPSEIAVG